MSGNLFLGRDIESLELPIKKLLKGDYLVFFNDSDPNFNEKEIPNLSKGLKPIKLKSKIKVEGSSILLYQKPKNRIPSDVFGVLGKMQRGSETDQAKLEEIYNSIADDIDEDIRRDILRHAGEDPEMPNDYYDIGDEEEEFEDEQNEEEDENYQVNYRQQWEADDIKWMKEDAKRKNLDQGEEEWLTEEEVEVDEEDFQD